MFHSPGRRLESADLKYGGGGTSPIQNQLSTGASMPRGAARFALALLLLASTVSAQQPAAKSQYSLKPTPKTIAWAYYDPSTPPASRVKSGDSVAIHTLITSSLKRLEGA